ncbi:hypothetical protein ACFVHW_10810, partial [Streptomyces sp. NPDC127110]
GPTALDTARTSSTGSSGAAAAAATTQPCRGSAPARGCRAGGGRPGAYTLSVLPLSALWVASFDTYYRQ